MIMTNKTRNKNKHKHIKIFILFSLVTLVSCSSIQLGQDFKLQTFASHAESGKTTKNEVLKWLGKPMNTGVALKENGERLTEWGYFFGTGDLSNMKNAKIKSLQIRFDNKGVLRSYNWSNSQ